MRITPYFEVNGNRYEFKRTRWLIAEYNRLNEEMPLPSEDKANAVRANNLVADAKKFADKAEEMWEELCKNPTPENRSTYSMFKEMSDEAVEKYNKFIAENNAINATFKHSVDILEMVAIKALSEQYFNFNESLAKQIWEAFVDSMESHDDVAEWLMAMAECLFGEDEDEEDTGFLAQKRKMDEEKANNRKSAIRKKR